MRRMSRSRPKRHQKWRSRLDSLVREASSTQHLIQLALDLLERRALEERDALDRVDPEKSRELLGGGALAVDGVRVVAVQHH